MTRVPVTRLPDGRLVYQGANGQFGIKQDVRVITPAQRWREIDQLPLHLKRFIWSASVELILDPAKPNDLASLEARERDRVRASALKFYGPDHPQATSDFKPWRQDVRHSRPTQGKAHRAGPQARRGPR